MKKIMILIALLLIAGACAHGGYVVKKGIQDAAIAIKTADELLDKAIPVLGEKFTQELIGTCPTREECEEQWADKMSRVEQAVSSLEIAKDLLLKFEKLFLSMEEGKTKKSPSRLIVKAANILHHLRSALKDLEAVGVNTDEVADAVRIMEGIAEALKGGEL
ncbi:MAG: hypothetical protein GWM98_04630 [Nitrospinaceae bacterium]|nr:hypothetical protein [Deltaproteobacteria bacterium]NIY14205.1 hypothetical protein [Nitrospinaceae bacterium]